MNGPPSESSRTNGQKKLLLLHLEETKAHQADEVIFGGAGDEEWPDLIGARAL